MPFWDLCSLRTSKACHSELSNGTFRWVAAIIHQGSGKSTASQYCSVILLHFWLYMGMSYGICVWIYVWNLHTTHLNIKILINFAGFRNGENHSSTNFSPSDPHPHRGHHQSISTWWSCDSDCTVVVGWFRCFKHISLSIPKTRGTKGAFWKAQDGVMHRTTRGGFNRSFTELAENIYI